MNYPRPETNNKKSLALTLGIFAGGLAVLGLVLVFLYYFVVHGTFYALPKVFTLVLPALTLCLGVAVIYFRHPVQALLCLIAIFFNSVLLLLAAGAEFLALVFLIVYVGAIAILFLFVIMLLNVKELSSSARAGRTKKSVLLACLVIPAVSSFGLLLSSELSKLLFEKGALQGEENATVALQNYLAYQFSDVNMFSRLLYSYYSELFIIASLLLLTARLGAIILATSAVEKT